MKKYSILLLCSLIAISAFASRTMVSSAADINGKFWLPGDTIVMTNGTWTNQSISFKAVGTEDEPIVLQAETPGEVILNGTSKLAFSGEYVEVSGLYFKDGTLSGSDVISFRTSSSSLAANCRLTNTTIENYNPANNTSDNKWVSIHGKNNTVDYCSFINKNNSGTLLVVWIKNAIPNHTIDHNYFGYRIANLDSSGKELNGQEIIRIGDSSTSLRNARVKVTNNFFEHCNGEIEIISNKSCENVYKNNVFFECVGMLTLRHGNRCLVEGNYFFGNNISNTGGVRIIGEDHTVYNNYFENLRGSGWRAALCMVRGKENSALNEYYQVKNAHVMLNTMVNCKQAFSINYSSSSSNKMPPIGSKIENNHVYNTTTANNNVSIYQTNVAEMDVTWKNNLMNKGSYNSFPYTPEEVIVEVDPSMILADTRINMYEPGPNSALSAYATNDYPDVTMDIRGRIRGTAKIPGASQLSGDVTLNMPDKTTTGVNYGIATPVKKIKDNKGAEMNVSVTNQDLVVRVTEPGILSIYNLSGHFLRMQPLNVGSTNIDVPNKGILLLNFVSKSGAANTLKVLNR